MRVLSGVQPSGALHIGNYLAAIKQWIPLQEKHECLFFIVDLHAVTVPYKPQDLRQNVWNAALDYLALGLDPAKSTIFIQSHVHQHAELAWLLETITPLGELERMTQFKEKSKHRQKANVGLGLFAYPALMAADILLYKTELVPVGEDQLQHVELARTLARKFNHLFGRTFPEPKSQVAKIGARIMSLADPTKKMSKSLGPAHFLAIFEPEEDIRQKIKSAVTDSGKEIVYDVKKKPAISNLLTIYSLCADKPISEIEKQYQGKGYAEFKSDLAEVVIETFRPFRRKREELLQNITEVRNILSRGAETARSIAEKTMKEVKEKMGLL